MRVGSNFGRVGALAVMLAAALLPGGPGRAAKPATEPPPAAAPAHPAELAIDGFRSARFGMTEKAVREAIHKDFADGKDLRSETNPTEKTAALSLIVADLVPDSGPARIAYIFGYKSHKLIQVNVLWSSDDKGSTPESVVATGNVLRDYFLGERVASEGRVVNAILPDGTIVILRAFDAAKHMVLIVLTGANPKQKPPPGHARPPLRLQLSYIFDSTHPDIFHLKKGEF